MDEIKKEQFDIKKKWKELFDKYSYNNPFYGELCLLVILGQAFKHKRFYKHNIFFDSRLHLFYFSPSGSGKSTAMELVGETCKRMKMKFDSVDEVSDASLIGSPLSREEKDYMKEQLKKEMKKDNKTNITDEDLEKIQKTEALLDGEGILYWDEGEEIFKEKSYSQHMMAYFQKAMNPIGSNSNKITKHLKNGSVSCSSEKSMLILSYLFDGIQEAVFDKGFFQRILIYIRNVDEKDREENSMTGLAGLSDSLTEKDIENIDEIIDYFDKIRRRYEHYQIPITKDLIPLFKTRIKNLYQKIKETNGTLKETMHKFLSRYENFLITIAYLDATMNMQKTITNENVKYAYNIINTCLNSIMAWIERDILIPILFIIAQA
jgi:hypothetical protein